MSLHILLRHSPQNVISSTQLGVDFYIMFLLVLPGKYQTYAKWLIISAG